jgi:uncharacterized membrane protein YgdD (TMEM256/DUF423 family)
MNWSASAAFLLALGVALGAFGAHGLRARLESSGMTSVYEKAVFYHFIHAIGILLVALLAKTSIISPAGMDRVGWLLLVGIILFSGSLYVLAFTGVRILGAITPLGGIAFIAGWVLLLFEVLRTQS